ncbi:MAG: molybdopterin molybdotransferase MoeA [Proteobacteria bacterium]|nr:molybdopterin molybdotransferase MoeA [Pseudomonadota bacterium]
MTVNLTTKLISYQQAIDIINEVSSKHQINRLENITLSDATGSLLASDVFSKINVPSFNNAAMDGFAVQTQQLNLLFAKNDTIHIKVTNSIQAGDSLEPIGSTHSAIACEIMTGAPVPDAFNAVVQIELVTVEIKDGDKFIRLNAPVETGKNIRKIGTDYQVNQLVVAKHTHIQAQHIMALATVGIENIDVIPKLDVAILSTGNELTKTSESSLLPGKIYNSNQPFLQSYCRDFHCSPVFIGSCRDHVENFNLLLDEALSRQVKIVLSTGAVSMGKHDFIPQVLLERGAKIHFHKAKIRPGKPILFAELPNGTLYFGLPGNPIAAAAGMRFFVSPLIKKMMGLKPEKCIKAELVQTVSKKLGFRTFAKARLTFNNTGSLQVQMLTGQGSFQTHSFAEANCWLILEEDQEHIPAGQIVNIVPMSPDSFQLQ